MTCLILGCDGQGAKEFEAVCVIAGIEEIVTPCGICRQSLLEFNRDMTVICVTPGGNGESESSAFLAP